MFAGILFSKVLSVTLLPKTGPGTLLASAIALCAGASACQAQVAIVANPNNPVSALTADQAAALYTGKSNRLPNGAAVVLVDQPESAAVRDQFYSKVAGKTPSQVKAAWTRLVFSGKAEPPKEAANSADVKKLVASNLNAIGYLEKGAVDGSVKVLLSID